MNLISIMPLMAQATGEGGQEPNMLLSFLPFIAIIAIFYFLFIRPQQKQQKKHQDMLTSLQKGDKVMTSGGLIGTIVGVNEDTITVKFGEAFKTEVGKSYITGKIEG
jgi:preprotein translocase subunit YajC